MRLLIMSRYCLFFTSSKSTSIGDLDLFPPSSPSFNNNPDIKINYDSDEWQVCVSPTHDTPHQYGTPLFLC